VDDRIVVSRWDGDYRADVVAGRFRLRVDEPHEAGGSDTGPQPTDLLLASVASCFTLAMSWAARKHGVALAGLEVTVTGAYDGPRFHRIEIAVSSGLEADVERRLVEAAKRVCYVTNTFRGPLDLVIQGAPG
jgi:uncharacterized OsmC-like protein